MSGNQNISTSETKLEALQLQSSAYGVTLPLVYGKTRLSGNLMWYGAFTATPHTSSGGGGGGKGGGVTQSSTTYTYSASAIMGLAEGPLSAVTQLWKGKSIYADDASSTALAKVGLSLATGAVGQATWSYLGTSFSSQALGYSGIAYVYAQNYALGSSASMDNHSFEVVAPGAYALGSTLPDADPAFIALDVLTNPRAGAGYPAGKLVDMGAWSTYCRASSIMLSPALTEQARAGEIIERLGRMTNTAPVWTFSGLKMVPYGDTAVDGNGYTFTPNITPVYDLTDDDFTSSSGDDPIQVVRKPQSDAYNCVKVEFLNRDNFYNTEIATAQDAANVDAYGLRVAETITAHWICTAAVAQTVAQLVLQRLLYIRNTYQFSLPWAKVLLEPMDLVTLTDTGLGFDRLPVRITEIGESEAGDLDVTAEEFPLGVAHSATYSTQASAGFQHNYAAAPGSVADPVFFEAPTSKTLTGLEVYAAVRGLSSNWGGCRVWVSLDGTNYKVNGTVYGGARFGTVTAPISSGSLAVQIAHGQLVSGSAADAANLSTLCYVGGAVPEYLAYQSATLSGVGAYTLAGLQRKAYGTNAANSSHTAGDVFVRVDDAIAKSGPLDLALVGKTIYIKFTSFNIYSAAEQSLADAVAYPYAITGAMVKLPPAAPAQFVATAELNGVRLACAVSDEPDVRRYEYRVGAAWASADVLTTDGGTSFLAPTRLAGTSQYWTACVDVYGNYSAPAGVSLTIAAPTALVVQASLSNAADLLSWAAPTSGFAIDRYEIRAGANWAVAALQGSTRATSYSRNVDYLGSRTYWVAAFDVAGNNSTPVSITTTITAPGAPVGVAGQIIGAKYQVLWSAPATGSLAVRRYVVRYGESFAVGTFVAEVDSTELRLAVDWTGSRTFWVAAVDVVGNIGTAASTTVAIAVPGAPQPVAAFADGTVTISWPSVASSLTVDYYQVSYGPSRTPLAKIYGNQATDVVTWGAASRTYYVRAVNVTGSTGAEGSVTLTSTALAAPAVRGAVSVTDTNFKLSWAAPAGSLPVSSYEVFDGAVSLGKASSLFYVGRVNWAGSKDFTVVATDVGGMPGAAGTVSIVISAPAAPAVTSQAVDNNVLLYWTQPAATLPIATFEIRRGASWAAGTVIGQKSGGFTTVFETASGQYTYWVAAVDTAGNYGTPGSVSTTVSQPPDYVLKADQSSAWGGNKVNAFPFEGGLILPVNTTETWAGHFSARSWTAPQAQVTAGFPMYIQPSLSPGYYEEVIDYGTTLAANRITVSYLLTTLAGDVAGVCDISTSNDGTTYTTYAGQAQIYATNFRYIKVRVTVTAAAQTGVATLKNLRVTLDSKLKTITGMVTVNAADAGGTLVYVTTDKLVTGTRVFVDVDSIQLTPSGTTAASAIYDFVDAPNPSSFKVLLFNSAGARISGLVSYTVRGF